ncbi:MAG: DUF1501 domain-containing protein [Actinobacteria bacterium]|nr:DUF1501 domain-containing protein [Actinomycetota bacterium]
MPQRNHNCCSNYTRSEMLRASAAQAGKGLPAIETGMPLPAGTGLSRRTFLSRSAGLALAVYGAGKLPFAAFEDGIAHAATNGRILVSVFFDGGIDSMSVLAPTGHPQYAGLRPTLALGPTEGTAFAEDTSLRWHPSASPLATLHGEGKVSTFPAIGYTSPNQSHFTSRHFYEIGELEVGARTGWLGRYIDRTGADDNPLQGLSLDGSLSPSIATASMPVAAVDDVTDYDMYTHGVGDPVAAPMYNSFGHFGDLPADSEPMGQVRNATAQTSDLRELLATFEGFTPPVAYPNTNFGEKLSGLAEMIGRGMPLSCVTVSAPGGYDTHSDQAQSFGNNLGRTCDAIYAFQRDLEARGEDDRVLMEVWSEFGRRPDENGSAGTDHGAAGLAFVIGTRAAGEMVGEFPGLTSFDHDDNLLWNSDFRGMYCSLFEQWLEEDAEGLIPGASGLPRYTLVS